ncbi:MAG TPA: hemolysin III family protein, partial [Lacipirellulaceae bacterium]|nr:hemolysin III family protein [Lacipirellulaceae bacterium]
MSSLTAIPGFAEPFSSMSHLAGAALFLVLGVALGRRGRGDALRVASLVVFVAGSVLLLSVSGVYHLLDPAGTPRYVLKVLDHAAIFVLIACSFSPVHIILFRGWGRWGMLALVWGFAATAITLKTMYFTSMPDGLGLALYLGMGWLGVYSGTSIWRRFGRRYMEPILLGGLAYSIGAVLEFSRWPVVWPGVIQCHEVFHLAVLVVLGFRWAFVQQTATATTE